MYPRRVKPFIKTIIEHGIIILDYQIGMIANKPRNGSVYTRKERSFIRGFMKHTEANRFIAWMNMNTDKIAYCVHTDPRPEFEKEYYEGDMTKSQGIIVSTEGLKDSITVTIPYIRAPIVLAKSSLDFDKLRAYLHPSVDVDMVVCIDPVYGRIASTTGGLYEDICNALHPLNYNSNCRSINFTSNTIPA